MKLFYTDKTEIIAWIIQMERGVNIDFEVNGNAVRLTLNGPMNDWLDKHRVTQDTVDSSSSSEEGTFKFEETVNSSASTIDLKELTEEKEKPEDDKPKEKSSTLRNGQEENVKKDSKDKRTFGFGKGKMEKLWAKVKQGISRKKDSNNIPSENSEETTNFESCHSAVVDVENEPEYGFEQSENNETLTEVKSTTTLQPKSEVELTDMELLFGQLQGTEPENYKQFIDCTNSETMDAALVDKEGFYRDTTTTATKQIDIVYVCPPLTGKTTNLAQHLDPDHAGQSTFFDDRFGNYCCITFDAHQKGKKCTFVLVPPTINLDFDHSTQIKRVCRAFHTIQTAASNGATVVMLSNNNFFKNFDLKEHAFGDIAQVRTRFTQAKNPNGRSEKTVAIKTLMTESSDHFYTMVERNKVKKPFLLATNNVLKIGDFEIKLLKSVFQLKNRSGNFEADMNDWHGEAVCLSCTNGFCEVPTSNANVVEPTKEQWQVLFKHGITSINYDGMVPAEMHKQHPESITEGGWGVQGKIDFTGKEIAENFIRMMALQDRYQFVDTRVMDSLLRSFKNNGLMPFVLQKGAKMSWVSQQIVLPCNSNISKLNNEFNQNCIYVISYAHRGNGWENRLQVWDHLGVIFHHKSSWMVHHNSGGKIVTTPLTALALTVGAIHHCEEIADDVKERLLSYSEREAVSFGQLTLDRSCITYLKLANISPNCNRILEQLEDRIAVHKLRKNTKFSCLVGGISKAPRECKLVINRPGYGTPINRPMTRPYRLFNDGLVSNDHWQVTMLRHGTTDLKIDHIISVNGLKLNNSKYMIGKNMRHLETLVETTKHNPSMVKFVCLNSDFSEIDNGFAKEYDSEKVTINHVKQHFPNAEVKDLQPNGGRTGSSGQERQRVLKSFKYIDGFTVITSCVRMQWLASGKSITWGIISVPNNCEVYDVRPGNGFEMCPDEISFNRLSTMTHLKKAREFELSNEVGGPMAKHFMSQCQSETSRMLGYQFNGLGPEIEALTDYQLPNKIADFKFNSEGGMLYDFDGCYIARMAAARQAAYSWLEWRNNKVPAIPSGFTAVEPYLIEFRCCSQTAGGGLCMVFGESQHYLLNKTVHLGAIRKHHQAPPIKESWLDENWVCGNPINMSWPDHHHFWYSDHREFEHQWSLTTRVPKDSKISRWIWNQLTRLNFRHEHKMDRGANVEAKDCRHCLDKKVVNPVTGACSTCLLALYTDYINARGIKGSGLIEWDETFAIESNTLEGTNLDGVYSACRLTLEKNTGYINDRPLIFNTILTGVYKPGGKGWLGDLGRVSDGKFTYVYTPIFRNDMVGLGYADNRSQNVHGCWPIKDTRYSERADIVFDYCIKALRQFEKQYNIQRIRSSAGQWMDVDIDAVTFSSAHLLGKATLTNSNGTKHLILFVPRIEGGHELAAMRLLAMTIGFNWTVWLSNCRHEIIHTPLERHWIQAKTWNGPIHTGHHLGVIGGAGMSLVGPNCRLSVTAAKTCVDRSAAYGWDEHVLASSGILLNMGRDKPTTATDVYVTRGNFDKPTKFAVMNQAGNIEVFTSMIKPGFDRNDHENYKEERTFERNFN